MKVFYVLMILTVLAGCTAVEPTDHYKDPEFLHHAKDTGYSKWD